MKNTIFTFILLFFMVCDVNSSTNNAFFPSKINYVGTISNDKNIALDGVYSVKVRLLKSDAKTELRSQKYEKIVFDKGQFNLLIGDDKEQSLAEITKNNSKLFLEISVDNQLYGPLVGIQPAGHSTQSRMAIAGVSNDKNKLHSKEFTTRSNSTSVQAVALKPQLEAIAVEYVGKNRRNPYTTVMRGPMISQPVSSLATIPNISAPFVDVEINKPRHEELFDFNGRRFGTENPNDVDDALAARSAQLGPIGQTPAASLNFPGVANVNGVLPPDIEGTVGSNHYVQMVNLAFAVFDKTGAIVAGPSNTNTLWAGFGGACQNDNSGDAIALYDQQADRYVLTQFAVGSAQSVCFAVSTTNDPLGTYYLYELAAQRFPDYYKLGVWSDPSNNAYYMSTNSGQPGAYDVYAIDRQSLLDGVVPRAAQFFQSFPNLLMPADQDGSLPAPIGSPGLLYTIIAGGENYFGSPPPANDSIDLYEFAIDWDSPANTTFTMINSFGPPEITDFIWTICGFFESNCLDQPNTTVNLDSGSWWPMQRFQYRNFGDYEMLLGTWTVEVDAAGDHAAPRWFELRKPTGGSWSVFQEGTHAPDSAHRWEPSISMNGQGDIGIVYNVLDAANNVQPGIRFAGRQASDPAGAFRDESSLIEATGVQTSTSNRWGDYASMDVDPVDDCRFWFTSEFIRNTGSASWETQIGSFNFPGCVSVVSPNASQEVCTLADSASYDLNLTGDFTATTNLSVTNCPAGASCAFSVNPVVNPDSSSQLIVSGLSTNTAGGNYQIGVTATDSITPSLTFDATVALKLVEGLPSSTSLTLPADTENFISTVSRQFSWSASNNTSTYLFELATDSAFTGIIESVAVTGTGYTSSISLSPETTYYWRVTTGNLCGFGDVSSTFSFITAPLPGNCLTGANSIAVDNYDFEDGMQGWTPESVLGVNSWTLSTSNPNTGAQHWHANDVDSESDTTLTSPTIVLPTGQRPLTLHFNNFQNMESNSATSCWDGGVLEISTDGGNNFVQISNNKLLTDPYTGPLQSNSILAGQNAWCGDPQPYVESIVDLDDYAGQSVQFRFRVVTDGAVGDEGWDIDDVRIQSCEALGNPTISVTKTATLTTDTGHPGEADKDDVITFSVSVENTGNVALTALVVNDSMEGLLNCSPTDLAVGQTATCSDYTYTVLQSDVDNGGSINNTATATMTDAGNPDVTGNASTQTLINQALFKDGFE